MAKNLKVSQRWGMTSMKKRDLRSRIMFGVSANDMEAFRVLARTMRLIVK